MDKAIATILRNPAWSRDQKISKLQILALRAFPSSPNQKAAVAAYTALMIEARESAR